MEQTIHIRPFMSQRWQLYEQVEKDDGEVILVYRKSGTFEEMAIAADRMANAGAHCHVFSEPKVHHAWASPEQILGVVAKIMHGGD